MTAWFSSGRVLLRAPEPHDADVIHTYLNHPDVYEDRQFSEHPPIPLSRAEVAEQLTKTSDTGRTFVIEAGHQVVGHAVVDWWWDALQPWSGLAIAPDHRRRGYGTEAAGLILGYLFDRTLAHVVTAEVGDWNEPGVRFVESLGFTGAGRFRHSVRRDGQWRDTLTFDLLRREWEGFNAAER